MTMSLSCFLTSILLFNAAVSESSSDRNIRPTIVEDRQRRLLSEAAKTPLPSIALIQFLDPVKKVGPYLIREVGLCTGSLISRRHVLTAAHCLTERKQLGRIQVTLGRQSLADSVSEKDTYGVHLPLPSNAIPAEWKQNGCRSLAAKMTRRRCADSDTYDVAILTLDREVELSDRIRPICIDRGYDGNNLTRATNFGWKASGRNAIIAGTLASPSSGQLRQLSLQVQGCQAQSLKGLLCTMKSTKDLGSEGGDSGGPLARYSQNKWKLIGNLQGAVNTLGPGQRVQILTFASLSSKKMRAFVQKATGGAAC